MKIVDLIMEEDMRVFCLLVNAYLTSSALNISENNVEIWQNKI